MGAIKPRPSSPSEPLQSNLNTCQFFYSRCSIGPTLLGVSGASAPIPSSATRTSAPSHSATTTMKLLEPTPTYFSLVRTLCDRRAGRRPTHEQSNIQIVVGTFNEFRDQISPSRSRYPYYSRKSSSFFFFFPRTCLYRTTLQPAFGGEETGT